MEGKEAKNGPGQTFSLRRALDQDQDLRYEELPTKDVQEQGLLYHCYGGRQLQSTLKIKDCPYWV